MSDMDYKELDEDAPEFERAGLKPTPREEPAPDNEGGADEADEP